MFDLLTNTEVMIDGKIHLVRMYDGMTGIQSRQFWIDDKSYIYNCVRYTDDIIKGNHFLYLIRWRDTPWDLVYIFIKEKYESELLEEEWRKSVKINLDKGE